MECSELRYKFSVWLSELLICLTVIRQYTTSHATDRHQDPKQKLWAGYRVPLPQCTSYFSSSSVRAFSMLCVYSKFRHHPHPLGYLCAKFRFVRGLHCNHSLNYQAYLMHWELKLSLRNKQCDWSSPRSEAKGYRAPSLQHTSYLWVRLICEASSIFHHWVWYRAHSLRYVCVLCMYLTFGHHPHPLGYACAKFRFCHALHCWASLWRKIVYSITRSINHSPTLFDSPSTEDVYLR